MKPAPCKSIAIAAISILVVPLLAQTVPQPTTDSTPPDSDIVHMETLKVSSGEWGALQSATAARRESLRIVDVVNPDDVGILPDFNVGETLQRLPGISIDLDQAEARFVTIRGFNANYNTTTINGSVFAVPDRNGRRVYMDVLPASLASAFEVIKSQTPDMEGHSVGGAINIQGPRAIRNKPMTFKAAGKIGWYTNDEGYEGRNPSGTADFLLTRNIGSKMGIAVSGNYYKRDSYTPQVEYGSSRIWYDSAGNVVSTPYGGTGYAVPTERRWYWYHNNRSRAGGTFKWEYRPTSNVEIWALAYYNKAKDNESRQTDLLGNWGSIKVANQNGNSGTISGSSIRQQQYLGQFDFERTLWGLQLGSDIRLGSDKLLTIRATYSGSRFRNPEHWAEWRQSGSQLAFDYFQDGDLFYFRDRNPSARTNYAAYAPYRRQFDNRGMDDAIYEVQADFEQKNIFGVRGLGYKVGGKYRRDDRDFDENRDRYLPVAGNTYNLLNADVVRTDLRLRPPGALDGQYIVVIDPVSSNRNFDAHIAANPGQWTFDPMTTDDNNLDYSTTEDVIAGYAMLTYTHDRFTILGGVRAEYTYDDSTGRILSKGSWGDITTTGHYNDWMPSVVATYDVTSHDKVRAAISSTIGRPPFNQFAPVGESVSELTDGLTVTRSNPNLKPRRSINYNLAFDHYFKGNKGLVGVGLYYNELRDEIYTASVTQPYFYDGSWQEATIRQPINSDHKTTVAALEFSLLRSLDFLPGVLSGLKINGNFTMISSDFRVLMTNGSYFRTRTAIGQPKRTANVALLYDWKKFSAKVALNYTSLKLTERINTDQSYRNRYDTASLRLTANASYKLNKNWRVDISGWNLTGEGRKEVLGAYQELPIVTANFGRAYFLGLVYSY